MVDSALPPPPPSTRHSKQKDSSDSHSSGPSIPPPPELPPNEKAPWINIPTSSLFSDWGKMVNSDNQSDVILQLGPTPSPEGRFHAHKLVLCSASDVFRRVFGIETKVKVQSLADCPGWNKKRLQKISPESVSAGHVAGFTHTRTRYGFVCLPTYSCVNEHG